MTYVKTRTTSSGLPSTSLVKSYRDERGRPRQRNLANLHAMPDVLSALAKLAVQRDRLRKEQERLDPEVEQADQFYKVITTNTLAGHRYSAEQRKEIDRLFRARKRLIKRLAAVKATLATIQKDGAVIRKHCTASEAEIQKAIGEYREELKNAEALLAFDSFSKVKNRREMRRLSLGPAEEIKIDRNFMRELMKG